LEHYLFLVFDAGERLSLFFSLFCEYDVFWRILAPTLNLAVGKLPPPFILKGMRSTTLFFEWLLGYWDCPPLPTFFFLYSTLVAIVSRTVWSTYLSAKLGLALAIFAAL